MNAPAPNAEPRPTALLRRADQAFIAAIVAVSLGVMAVYWLRVWGEQDDLIDVEPATAPGVVYRIDLNSAPVEEFAVLPGIGEVLAQRIVESRAAKGPFRDHDDLRRVRGIGPRTLERIRPYLLPIPQVDSVAGP